jgi:hypothetical protein
MRLTHALLERGNQGLDLLQLQGLGLVLLIRVFLGDALDVPCPTTDEQENL